MPNAVKPPAEPDNIPTNISQVFSSQFIASPFHALSNTALSLDPISSMGPIMIASITFV
jgi:hypothetical protein